LRGWVCISFLIMLPMEFLIKRLIETWIFSVIYVIAQCISISKSLVFQLGILLFLANEEKTVSNNLATNLAFLESWQTLPFRRAYMLTETTWHHGLWWRRDSRRTRQAVGLLLAWLSDCFPCLLSFSPASGVDG